MQVERGKPFGAGTSGARVRNTWIICLFVGNNISKGMLIPHKTTTTAVDVVKDGLFLKAVAKR
tara:strand:- start:477 stop:665 length:189 start_codon:yes stop_codon:yes gene_type:complete